MAAQEIQLYNGRNYYCIVSQTGVSSGSLLALDTRNGVDDGSVVHLENLTYCDAQVWRVFYSWDGTGVAGSYRCLTNWLTGKLLGAAKTTPASNDTAIIATHTDVDFASQKLLISKTTSTATVDGKEYYLYKIHPASNTSLSLTAGAAGEQAVWNTDYETSNQRWLFLPSRAIRDSGRVEVESRWFNLCLSADSANPVNGSSVVARTPGFLEHQQFEIMLRPKDGSGYDGSFRLYSATPSAMLVTMDGSTSGNHQLYLAPSTAGTDQLWKAVTDPGSGTEDYGLVRGFTMANLASVMWPDNSHVISVQDALESPSGIARVDTYTSTFNSSFNIVPSARINTELDVPFDIGAVTNIFDDNADTVVREGTRYRLTWKCHKPYITTGPVHFQVRRRSRLMRLGRSTWDDWGLWGGWETPSYTQKDNQFWLHASEITSFPWENGLPTYKMEHEQYQIRMATVSKSINNMVEVGYAATVDIYTAFKPTITWYNASMGPRGLRLHWNTSYSKGSTTMIFRNITSGTSLSNAKKIYAKGDFYVESTPYDNSTLIPLEDLFDWVADGSRLYLTYDLGYDTVAPFIRETNKTCVVTYDAGTTSVGPTLRWHGDRLFASAPNLGTTRMWVKCIDEKHKLLYPLTEMKRLTTDQVNEIRTWPGFSNLSPSQATFEIIYPMGSEFDIFTESHSPAETAWGTDVTRVNARNKRFHAFTKSDGTIVYIDQFESGGANFQETTEAVYQSDILDARKYESVSSLGSFKTSFSIKGILTDTSTSTVDDFKSLIGEHVVWRGPNGEFGNVFISSITFEEMRDRCVISISAIRETL